jgi:hypothetical protein
MARVAPVQMKRSAPSDPTSAHRAPRARRLFFSDELNARAAAVATIRERKPSHRTEPPVQLPPSSRRRDRNALPSSPISLHPPWLIYTHHDPFHGYLPNFACTTQVLCDTAGRRSVVTLANNKGARAR